jgi:cytochrome P450
LDFIYQSISATRQHRNLQLWRWFFSTYGTEESPYTVETKIGTTRYIITADHNIIKAVLATQFADFGKGEAFHRSWSDFLGDSIFTTDGPAWHDSRKLIRPLFVKQRIGDLEIFERYAQKLMGLIYKQGQKTDLGQLFYRFTLDVATDFLFGESVSSLEKPQTEFATAISEVQRVQAKLARSGYDKSNKNQTGRPFADSSFPAGHFSKSSHAEVSIAASRPSIP